MKSLEMFYVNKKSFLDIFSVSLLDFLKSFGYFGCLFSTLQIEFSTLTIFYDGFRNNRFIHEVSKDFVDNSSNFKLFQMVWRLKYSCKVSDS